MGRKRERQRMLFPIHYPKPRPLPKITEAQAAEIIRRDWRMPDGSAISQEQAEHWACTFIHYLKYEPGRISLGLRPRKRPERPTEKRMTEFLSVETDWVRAMK